MNAIANRNRLVQLREWAIGLYKECGADRQALHEHEVEGVETLLAVVELRMSEWSHAAGLICAGKPLRAPAKLRPTLERSLFDEPEVAAFFEKEAGMDRLKRYVEAVDLLRVVITDCLQSPA